MICKTDMYRSWLYRTRIFLSGSYVSERVYAKRFDKAIG